MLIGKSIIDLNELFEEQIKIQRELTRKFGTPRNSVAGITYHSALKKQLETRDMIFVEKKYIISIDDMYKNITENSHNHNYNYNYNPHHNIKQSPITTFIAKYKFCMLSEIRNKANENEDENDNNNIFNIYNHEKFEIGDDNDNDDSGDGTESHNFDDQRYQNNISTQNNIDKNYLNANQYTSNNSIQRHTNLKIEDSFESEQIIIEDDDLDEL